MKCMGVLGLGLILLTACGKKSDSSSAASGLSAGFAANCASCHGADASGGSVGRPLPGKVGTLANFSSIVRNGRGEMPLVKVDKYSDADLQADYNVLK